MKRIPGFTARSGGMPTRAQRRGWVWCLLGHHENSWRGAGLPSYRAILFPRAEVSYTAGTGRASPLSAHTGIAFGDRGPLGSQNDKFFGAGPPPARALACLRIDHPVAGRKSLSNRKAGYRLAGLSPWPDGIRTRWMATSRFSSLISFPSSQTGIARSHHDYFHNAAFPAARSKAKSVCAVRLSAVPMP